MVGQHIIFFLHMYLVFNKKNYFDIGGDGGGWRVK